MERLGAHDNNLGVNRTTLCRKLKKYGLPVTS